MERFIKLFKQMLHTVAKDFPRDFDVLLPELRMAYMARVHRSCGYSPFQMLSGRPMNVLRPAELLNAKSRGQRRVTGLDRPAALARLLEHDFRDFTKHLPPLTQEQDLFLRQHADNMRELDRVATLNLQRAAGQHVERMRARMQHSRFQTRPFRVGDQAFIDHPYAKGDKVFQQPFAGPYTVTDVDEQYVTVKGGDGDTYRRALDQAHLYYTLEASIREAYADVADRRVPASHI